MKQCSCKKCAEREIRSHEEEGTENRVLEIIKLAGSAVLLVLTMLFVKNETLKLALFIVSALICGYEILFTCFKNIIHLEFFDENTLMVIASVVAFILGEYFEGVIIILLYGLGEFLEDLATDRSREKIAGLASLKVLTVNLLSNGEIEEVSPEDVEVGSVILIKKGERVPIDGVLIDSVAELDLKDVTGESKFYSIEKDGNVFSGAINVGNAFYLKTTKIYKDSTVEKIISMVEKSSERKAKSQKFITAFAKIYTPCVVLLSVLVAVVPPLFDSMNFSKWIYKALTFLIVSCPCALVISVPLGFFIGIGSLSKNGVLVKGGNYIETLSKVKTAVFDKTGTLTNGSFNISKVITNGEYSDKELINIAASIEKSSTHPLAKSLIKNNELKTLSAFNVKEYPGKGITGDINGKTFLVGNVLLLNVFNVLINNIKEDFIGTHIFVADKNKILGIIEFEDEIKCNTENLVSSLKMVSVKDTAIISGDDRNITEKLGNKIGISKVYAELLPDEKVKKLSEIMKNANGKVLYCGDGVNDSPSIALADVGVAMGALGSETAIDCADVVISDDNVMKIPYSIRKSKSVMRKIKINVIGSILVKIAFMVIGVLTSLPVYIAMVADVGIMLLAVLNSLSIGFKSNEFIKRN